MDQKESEKLVSTVNTLEFKPEFNRSSIQMPAFEELASMVQKIQSTYPVKDIEQFVDNVPFEFQGKTVSNLKIARSTIGLLFDDNGRVLQIILNELNQLDFKLIFDLQIYDFDQIINNPKNDLIFLETEKDYNYYDGEFDFIDEIISLKFFGER